MTERDYILKRINKKFCGWCSKEISDSSVIISIFIYKDFVEEKEFQICRECHKKLSKLISNAKRGQDE